MKPVLLKRIFLGYPLDILLNRDCKLKDYEEVMSDIIALVRGGKDNTYLLDTILSMLINNRRKLFLNEFACLYWLIITYCTEPSNTVNEEIKKLNEKIKACNTINCEGQKLINIEDIEKIGTAVAKCIKNSNIDKKLIVRQFEKDVSYKNVNTKIYDAIKLICKMICKRLEEKDNETIEGIIGGIILPQKDHPGSGNILIRGKPGTGKSTLALQMAVACTCWPNNRSAIYITLEQPVRFIKDKCKRLGWDNRIKIVKSLCDIDDSASEQEIGKALAHVFTQSETKCPLHNPMQTCNPKINHTIKDIPPQVLLPLLTPRSLAFSDSHPEGVFWERYQQIEKILIGCKYLRNPNSDDKIYRGYPPVSMVCIDSLNVFGDKPLTREQMFKLFDLFERNECIGVFTAEEIFGETGDNDSSTMNYLADIVIHLYAEEDNHYSLRYFEIEKSRYQHQVYGKHPFRIADRERTKNAN